MSNATAPRRCGIASHRLVKEASLPGSYLPRRAIRQARDVFDVMAPLAAIEPAEVFWVLGLDAQHKIVADGIISVTRGILNSSLVHPREVFRAALAANAYAIILCHNHPSGDPTPSGEDRLVTSQLVSAGKILGIDVLDHLIVGDGRFTSFAESGLL